MIHTTPFVYHQQNKTYLRNKNLLKFIHLFNDSMVRLGHIYSGSKGIAIIEYIGIT